MFCFSGFIGFSAVLLSKACGHHISSVLMASAAVMIISFENLSTMQCVPYMCVLRKKGRQRFYSLRFHVVDLKRLREAVKRKLNARTSDIQNQCMFIIKAF